MFTESVLIAIAVAAAAGLMRGFAGVGSGMLMAPIFAVLFGPVATVAIIICMEIIVTAQLLPG
ncbi:MAG: sulfite exporter TauE/SafE family protein, partial [Rhodospirillales bacterium]|nr:sulfite exporter TauE/SafE family protein [Rhodospirillales bacterium]